MADSGITTTVVVVPEAPGSELVELDPFWSPIAIGNGRIWISGRVAPEAAINRIEWRVNSGAWRESVGELGSLEQFGFYITGDSPSSWGTVEVSEVTQPTGTYFSTFQVEERPRMVTAESLVLAEAPDLATVASTSQMWYYDEVEKRLFFSTEGHVLPGETLAIIDPIFNHGSNYLIEIQAVDTLDQEVTVVTEIFVWPYEVRNYVDRYLRVLLPSWAVDSRAAKKWYILLAKQLADKYAMMTDCIAQSQIDHATWSLGMWEDQLGVPSVAGLTINQRRELLHLRRKADLSRKGLIDAVRAVVPDLAITATYDEFRIDIKISGAPNLAIRRAIEQIVTERKPIGVRVVVSYGQFIAGVSLAGDSL